MDEIKTCCFGKNDQAVRENSELGAFPPLCIFAPVSAGGCRLPEKKNCTPLNRQNE